MALLKGNGAMTDVNLIVKFYTNGKTQDGKTQYADVMVDARDSRGPEQTNLHLKSEREENPETGKTRYNNAAPYSVGQMEEMLKAAGPNVVSTRDKDGAENGKVFAVKANVMKASRGTGLVVNSKSVKESDFTVDDKTMDQQFASMKAASAQRAASKSADAEAPAPEAEKSAEVDEPSVG